MNSRIYRFITGAAVIAASAISCARITTEDSQIGNERAFNAWMYVHYPEIDSTGNGIYIIDDIAGNGEEVADSCYLLVHYEQRVMEDSSLISYTGETLAKQMGTYVRGGYYGPEVMQLLQSSVSQGVYDLFNGGRKTPRMRVGGTRTAIIPSWLSSGSGKNAIYKINVVHQVKDIKKWEIEQLEDYMRRNNIPFADTAGHYGLYFWRNKVRERMRGVSVDDSHKMPSDTTIYINYIGRRADGQVFDTNIKDTAKVWGIYSSAASYTPSAVTWSSDSTALKLGGSTVISGFSRTLWQMHPFESAVGMFTSDYGYSTSGSGSSIKGYMPLVFEIDIVEKD